MHNNFNLSYPEAQSVSVGLSVSVVLFRFGLLPLSMSNTRHTKAGRQAVDPVSRVSCRKGLSVRLCGGIQSVLNWHVDIAAFILFFVFTSRCLTLGKHCLLHSAFPVFWIAGDQGKFICALCRCSDVVFVCVSRSWCAVLFSLPCGMYFNMQCD